MHRSSGVSDLRIEMERGREIRGRLQDASDRAAPGYVMIATTLDSGAWGRDSSGVDGSFRIGGLAPKPHSIVGGAELAGFALTVAADGANGSSGRRHPPQLVEEAQEQHDPAFRDHTPR